MRFNDYDQQSVFWMSMEIHHLNIEPSGEIHHKNARFVTGGKDDKTQLYQSMPKHPTQSLRSMQKCCIVCRIEEKYKHIIT